MSQTSQATGRLSAGHVIVKTLESHGVKRVYSVPFMTLGDTATHEVGHWVSVVTDADRPTSTLRSIRVIKDVGAGNQAEACHGIIAVLIGL